MSRTALREAGTLLANLRVSPVPRHQAEGHPWPPEVTCALISCFGQRHMRRSDRCHSGWMHLIVSPSLIPAAMPGDLLDGRGSISVRVTWSRLPARQTCDTDLAGDAPEIWGLLVTVSN